jgi:hypothetical protein
MVRGLAEQNLNTRGLYEVCMNMGSKQS